VGQDHELLVPLALGELDQSTLQQAVQAFHAIHEEHHGYALPDRRVEFVDLNVTAIVGRPHATCRAVTLQGAETTPAPTQAVFIPETGWVDRCPVRHRQYLEEGSQWKGPLLIRQYDSTTFVAPGYRAEVDRGGSLIVRPTGEVRV